MLNTTTDFIALHRDKYAVPILLNVAKVSGIGEDTMFMGVMEVSHPVQCSKATSCIWN